MSHLHCNTVSTSGNSLFTLWHRSLGHPSPKIITHVLSQCNLLNSCNKISDFTTDLCDACCMEKLHQLPCLVFNTTYNALLELVYYELWGPASMPSKSGSRYYVYFIDAYLRYTCIYLLINKSQTFQAFVQYKQMMETKIGLKLKSLQTDNGKEYLSNAFY